MIQEIIGNPPEWLVSFGLADRIGTPDLFLSRENVLGYAHASAMRLGFELGVSGYLCVGTVPTEAFLIRKAVDQTEVDRIHKALWNQGLASLLLVVVSDAIQVYSLWRRPVAIAGKVFETPDKRLIEVLDQTRIAPPTLPWERRASLRLPAPGVVTVYFGAHWGRANREH